MGSIPAIQFTQEQARAIAGVSSQAIRHWRKVVPYLASKSGKAARFSFTEVIGLAVIREIVEGFGISVGCVQVGIDSLFGLLAETRPSELQNAVLVVAVNYAELRQIEELSALNPAAPTLLVPCDPLLEKMRGYVLPGLPVDPQMNIPFPPQAVER